MPHTDTSNKQATNRTSCHATHTDTSNKQTTNCTSYHASHTETSKAKAPNRTLYTAWCTYQKTHAILPTKRTSCHSSCWYQLITVNKSCFLPCLTQIPAKHSQQIVNLAMPHTDASNQRFLHAIACFLHGSFITTRVKEPQINYSHYVYNCSTSVWGQKCLALPSNCIHAVDALHHHGFDIHGAVTTADRTTVRMFRRDQWVERCRTL